jgi:hypothetical protein
MAWRWSAILVAVLGIAALTPGAQAAKKPPYKDACRLVTGAEINSIMGRKLKRDVKGPEGCRWASGVQAEVGLQITGFKKLSDAKEYLNDGPVRSYELCIDPPNKFLPHSGLGNEAWLDSCNANVAFRVGHIVGEVTAFSADVTEGSHTDAHRATAIARKAVRRLQKLRCPPSFCR